MAFTERYSSLLRFPGVLPVLAVGALARLAVSMYGLALLLLAKRATGSLTDAGVIAATAAVGYAVTGPLLGRLADRFGPVRPLVGTAVTNAVAFTGTLVVTGLSAPVVAIAAAALLVGASVPPVSACQRAMWRELLAGRDGLLDTALALDSFFLDVFLIAGPLLVTGLVVFAGPASAVIATATLMLVGSAGFAALRVCRGATRRGSPLRARGLGPLRAPGFRLLVLTIAAAGMALGIVRISLIGFAEQVGAAAAGGLLYTAIGIGSAAGGLWYGSRTWTIPLWRRYSVLLAVYAGCVLPLLTGPGTGSMFAIAVITGLALSPVTICEFALVGRCAPATTIAEAFAWATTATFAGNALGTGLAGVLVEQVHWRAALGAAALVLAVAAVATAWRRDLLRPAEPSANNTHSALSTDTG